MERYAPAIKDLAARDVVSRAILREIREGRGVDGKEYVHLDLTHLGEARSGRSSEEIASFAKTYLGIDPVTQPIPVAPTCHYVMGGIPTDGDGRVFSDESGAILPGLYAAGESACLSVHGANRLGCNSLLDLLVFGKRSGAAMRQEIAGAAGGAHPTDPLEAVERGLEILMSRGGAEPADGLRRAMQSLMMEHGSVFRTEAGLMRGIDGIRDLKDRTGARRSRIRGGRSTTSLWKP